MSSLDICTAIVKDGINRLQEGVVGGVVESLLSKEERLNQLQELQKWGMVKCLHKVLFSKLAFKESTLVTADDFSLVRAFYGSDGSPHVEAHKPGVSDQIGYQYGKSVGDLTVRINTGRLILLGPGYSRYDNVRKSYEFKVTIKCGNRVQSSGIRTLQKLANGEVLGESAVYTPLHELSFKDVIEFTEINDIWDDICIDIMYRKSATGGASDSPENIKTGIESRISESKTPTPPNSTPTLYESALVSPLSNIAMGNAHFQNFVLSSVEVVDWKEYGRLVIPLSNFLCWYYNHDNRLGKMDDKGFSDIWTHIYPIDSNSKKFYRPIPGYPEFGMRNPVYSLGLLSIGLKFDTPVLPLLTSLLSNMRPPANKWRTPSQVEPQYLFMYRRNTEYLNQRQFRWVSLFFCLRGAEAVKRNSYDLFMIAVFYIVLSYGFVLASVRHVPICVALCVICISLSYKLGHLGTVLKDSDKSDPNSESPVEISKNTTWYRRSTIFGTLSRKDAPDSRIDRSISDTCVLNISSTDHGNVIKKIRESNTQVYGARNKPLTQPLSASETIPLNSPNPPTATHSFCNSGIRKSVLQSLFGPLHISVDDQFKDGSSFPVFADDAEEQDLPALFDDLVKMFTNIQLFFGTVTSCIEKIQFSFNWDDPTIIPVSYIVVVLVALTMYVCAVILSYIPSPVIRLAVYTFFLYKQITQQFQLLKKKDLESKIRTDSGSVEPDTPCEELILDKDLQENLLTEWQEDHQTPNSDSKLATMWDWKNIQNSLMESWQSIIRPSSRENIAKVISDRWSPQNSVDISQQPKLYHSQSASNVSSSSLYRVRMGDFKPGAISNTKETQMAKSQSSEGVRVLQVSAKVLVRNQRDSKLYSRIYYWVLNSFWYLTARLLNLLYLFILKPSYLRGLGIVHACIYNPLRNFFLLAVYYCLVLLDLITRYIAFWWWRAPDRREMEHRKIAQTQYISSLDALLPPSANNSFRSFLDSQFRSQYIQAHPLTGPLSLHFATSKSSPEKIPLAQDDPRAE